MWKWAAPVVAVVGVILGPRLNSLGQRGDMTGEPRMADVYSALTRRQVYERGNYLRTRKAVYKLRKEVMPWREVSDDSATEALGEALGGFLKELEGIYPATENLEDGEREDMIKEILAASIAPMDGGEEFLERLKGAGVWELLWAVVKDSTAAGGPSAAAPSEQAEADVAPPRKRRRVKGPEDPPPSSGSKRGSSSSAAEGPETKRPRKEPPPEQTEDPAEEEILPLG